MDKENVDYSLVEDSFNPFPIAKSTELVDRRRPSPLGNATNSSYKLDLSQSGLSNLGDLELTTSTRHGNPTCDLNTSELSVQAGASITPKNDDFTRPDSFFSTFSNMKDEESERGTPDFLKQMERDVNFEKLARQHAREHADEASRNSTRVDEYIHGDFHAYRTPKGDCELDSTVEEDATPVRSNSSRPRK